MNIEQPIMSAKEARKKLGAEFRDCSNDEIELITKLLNGIAEEFVANSVPKFSF